MQQYKNLPEKHYPTSSRVYSKNTPTSSHVYSKNTPTSSHVYSKNTPTSSHVYSKNTPTSSHVYSKNTPTSSHVYSKNTPTSSHVYFSHFVIAFAFAMLSSFGLKAQQTHHVTPTGSGNLTGESWQHAASDLWFVLSNANPGDEVWIAAGVYLPASCSGACTISDREASFPLKPGVQVIGGFLGNETSASQANPQNQTVLSGDIGILGDPSDNSFSVVLCQDCGSQALLKNVVIRDGNADDSVAANNLARGRAGGGLYLEAVNGTASPTLRTITFFENQSVGRGAALFGHGLSNAVNPRLEGCNFSMNKANAEGGALGFHVGQGSASPSFFDCSFRENQTHYAGTVGQAGGAIFVSAEAGPASLSFERCLFQQNRADPNLGASVNGNSSGNGGAIYITADGGGSAHLEMKNSILDQNQAFSAGAIYLKTASANFESVTITENIANGNGGSCGGIYLNASTANLVNCLSYNNTVPLNPYGGLDLRFVNGQAVIEYSLFASADEQALFSRASTANSDTLQLGSGVLFAQDPGLGWANGYPEILQATSAAIDAGTANITSVQDYLGNPRVAQTGPDLGAVESNLAPLPVELLSFKSKATTTAVELEWQSLSEVNLSGYRVERKRPDGGFASLVFVPAMELGNYTYHDRGVVGGNTYYYRLTSIDHDGQSYESEIITATVQDAQPSRFVTKVYPNPSGGYLQILISPAVTNRTVYAAIIDERGRRVRFWPVTKDGEHRLDLQGLPNGNYILNVKSGDYSESTQFVLQKQS